MKTNIYPPPIYRLDKIDNYIKIKLDDYLRESKKLSRNAFNKVSFMKMFFNNEMEQAKILLSEVGNSNSIYKNNPYSMSFDRAIYGYSKDPEATHLEKEFFKFYIISLEKHLQVLTDSINFENSTLQKTETIKIYKNSDPTIFKNDKGQTLFDELHQIYKDDNKRYLANYSFVFYSMQKKYLVCTGAKFLHYLATLDIYIDKIDTRQSGITTKTPLFNSIEAKYL